MVIMYAYREIVADTALQEKAESHNRKNSGKTSTAWSQASESMPFRKGSDGKGLEADEIETFPLTDSGYITKVIYHLLSSVRVQFHP